ncbi:hypothetical protein FRC10_010138 [Ceratobasidium sp. 414]|nr:hypothetical protein FRC10_010138 [Ceratobasidium sp. 414]
MFPAIAGALFGLAPLAIVLAPGQAVAQLQWPELPNNLTQDVLQVAFAISPPCVNNTYCQLLTGTVYCAICMSNPTDNQTTADQTQAASAGHAGECVLAASPSALTPRVLVSAFHVACNAYEELINGTASTTSMAQSSTAPPTVSPTASAAASNAGGNKVSTGTIVGGVVGGVLGLVAVLGIIYIISLLIKRSNQPEVSRSSVSYMGSENKSPIGYNAPYPHASMTHYGSPGHVSPLIPQPGYNGGMPEPMNPQQTA